MGDRKVPGLQGSRAGWQPCPSTGDGVREAPRQLLHPGGSWQRAGRVPQLFPPLADTPRARTHTHISAHGRVFAWSPLPAAGARGGQSRGLGSASSSRARGGSAQLLVVPLEAGAEPLPGQANASDSATAGMLSVPARTCPSAGNETPRSSLHPSSSSLPSTFSGGDTRWLSQKPSAKSGPARLLPGLLRVPELVPSPGTSDLSQQLGGRAAPRRGRGLPGVGQSLD